MNGYMHKQMEPVKIKLTNGFSTMSSKESQKIDKKRLGFIGGGNMAQAICEGMVSCGRAQYSQVYVSGPHEERLGTWKNRGAQVSTDNGFIVNECDVIFLTVKPQFLAEAIANAKATSDRDASVHKLFISVLAGVELQTLEKTLSTFEDSRVIRVMPNIALTVGEGCVAFCPGKKATQDDIALVRTIFEVSGLCKLVPESMIDAVGALTGSGPAFIFTVIEALSDGAVKMGVPREMSTKLAAQMVLGSAKMVLDTGLHTGTLKDQVCSPGGITIAGIHALEKGGLRSALMDAVEIATLKNKDLRNYN